jgi:nucleoside-diphosphate-sugar epimerase
MDFGGITLVTGAAGFMGKYVVRHLAELGVRVRATDLPREDTSYFDDVGAEFIGADLTKPETLPILFDTSVDRVIHLGAICNFSTPYKKLHPVNVIGVHHITRLALAAGVKRYVHVGSTSVYGPYRGRPFSENAPRNPQDAYGTSKRDGEDIVWRSIQDGLPAIITRPCTVYGPGCSDGAGKAFSRPTSITAIPGNGRQLLSNVRAEDVAAAVVHLSHMVVKAAARVHGSISKVKGRIPDLEYDAVRYLADDYVVDNTALKSTGYELLFPDFRESMQQIGEWYATSRTKG